MARHHQAFASASTSYSQHEFDVFINHRGPDVKTTFASDLYRRLRDHGIRVFLDKPELKVGHNIISQIRQAIETAPIHIAIFSSTYAESRWCLNELMDMVEAYKSKKATIIPVFYHVKPTDLRWTAKGAYAKAFHNHEMNKRYDTQIIQSWKEALSQVSTISGLELDAFNGDEEELFGKLLEVVVPRVLKIHKEQLKYVAEHPAGLKEKLQEFENTVLSEQHNMRAMVVGIVGLGGVGKTTLAKEFFNSKISYYDGASFLFDVGENAAKSSLTSLQSRLLKDLTERDVQIDSIHEGIEQLRKHLSSCRALIILDNVDHTRQLEAFLPIKDILMSNSLILVTCRDKQVLQSLRISEASIYKLTGLNRLHSEELFCSYAFLQQHPLHGFEDLVDRFLTACDGLPLSLKVFGALLYEKTDKSYWQELLNRLDKAVEVHDSLKISYDSLNEEEQQIFLDVACFFIGEDRDTTTRICGLVSFTSLEMKCLVDVDPENNKIKMHDHVRDLGRNIAEGLMPYRLSRQKTQDIDDLLDEQSSYVLSQSRGISMIPPVGSAEDVFGDLGGRRGGDKAVGYLNPLLTRFGNHNWKPVHNNRFRGQSNLKFVAAQDAYLEELLWRAESPNLIWLRWYKCPFSSLPSWIPRENLAVLEVAGSKLEKLWQHESEAPLQLRELNIFARLSGFPNSIGQLKNLEKIVVKYFLHEPSTITSFPQEFCHLRSLKYLVLKRCSRLMLLPDSFGDLTNLQYIDLEGASNLQKLPNSFGNLTLLKHLCLARCVNLTISSETLANITTLEYLDLSCCRNVKELPPQVAHQRSLKKLFLYGMNFRELPSGIEDLCNLECLELGSNLFQVLPPSIVSLKSLKSLSLRDCPILIYLPEDLNMNNLEILKLFKVACLQLPFILVGEEIETLLRAVRASSEEEYLLRLKDLHLGGILSSKVSFPPGVCPKLQNLYISDCQCLVDVGALPATLMSLTMSRCCALRQIRGLCALEKLQHLHLSLINSELEELPNLETLKSLEELVFSACYKLKRIQGLGKLTKLRKLRFQYCNEIQELPGVENLMSLEFLLVHECQALHWGEGVLEQLRRRLKEGCHVYTTDLKGLCKVLGS